MIEKQLYSAINTWNSLQKQLKHFLLHNLPMFQQNFFKTSENLLTLTHVSCFMLI